MRIAWSTVVLCGALAMSPQVGWAQQDHEHMHAPEAAFGHINFPTSCAKAVQPEFEMAVAELHSFEYSTALKAFHKIQGADPGCAIAYWGEAVSLYHPLWNNLSEGDLTVGWGLVEKAQAAKETSAREAGYIAAATALYKPGKQSHEDRADAYANAMSKLHDNYPDDEEAAIIYALSLLGSESPSDTSLSHSKKAVAILNGIMAKDPEHPGVTHYIIHACDNPKMAPEGLAAARQYASIAPSSAHAVHMPSHIFARLGLWQESIKSNLAAMEVAKKGGEETEYFLHPADFLMYAYLQTGQDEKARAVESEAIGMKNSGFGHGRENYYYYVQAHFPAMVALETKDWKAAVALQVPAGAGSGIQETVYATQAIGAGHLKDVAAAKKAVKGVEAAATEDEKKHPSREKRPVDTDVNEAKAWLAFAEGRNDEAFALLKPVIERQDAVGKGEVELPAREMYADMLLELNRPKQALEQYQLSLKTDPNRFNGLYGAGRASEAAGQQEAAVGFYKQLLLNCEGSQRTELTHAKKVIAEVSTAQK